jgi:hypothetical protein
MCVYVMTQRTQIFVVSLVASFVDKVTDKARVKALAARRKRGRAHQGGR